MIVVIFEEFQLLKNGCCLVLLHLVLWPRHAHPPSLQKPCCRLKRTTPAAFVASDLHKAKLMNNTGYFVRTSEDVIRALKPRVTYETHVNKDIILPPRVIRLPYPR